MIQRRNLLLGTASLALSSLACQPAQAAGFRPNLAGLEHRVTNASAPEVFFIPELSDAAMLRNNNAVYTGAFGCTYNSPQVMRIRNPVQ